MNGISLSDMGLGFSLAAFLICLTNLFFTLVERRTDKPQNKIFITQLCIFMINAVTGMISTFTETSKYTSDSAFALLKCSRYVYFLTHSLIPPMFFYYILFVTGRIYKQGHSRNGFRSFIASRYPAIIIIINELIIALNPLTLWVYYFDGGRQFHRAWGEFIFIYAPSALWMTASFILMLKTWNILSTSRKYALSFCYMLGVIGIVIQLLFSKFRIEVLMETLGFTGVLIFAENEDDRMDVSVGTYNTAAFKLDLSAAIRNGIHGYLLIVRNIEIDMLHTASGRYFAPGESYVPERAAAACLAEFAGRDHVYSIGRGALAAVFYHMPEDEAATMADIAAQKLCGELEIDELPIRLNCIVMLLDMPGRASSPQDVLYIADCPIPENDVKSVMYGSDLDWIVRRAAVEAAVKRGLAEGSFEVRYQPTFTIDRQLHGAEALLRMHDRELGDVYPDEFIPVAEQLGMIGEIDSFVFGEVCRFIAERNPRRMGVECINVNLSVLECMKEGFADNLIRAANEAGIPKNEIVFEITESVGAEDLELLSAVIEKLCGSGFTFAIDDFGTGYSNLSASLSLGAELIKIDKSVLWGSEKSEHGSILLGAVIKMIKAMRKKPLAEGVETEEQIELLKELGCAYLQGFYFSKALPEGEFLRFITEYRA